VPADTTKLGTIMGIWAHPDDESFMVGGILSMAAAAGQKVICITATKGEAGVQNESKWPAATLAETRSKELAAALKILGIKEQQWLGYTDGGCADVSDDEAVAKIIDLINKYTPDTIITFPPDGMTGHPDHQSVSRWARLAAAKSGSNPEVYFAVQTQESYDSFLKVMDEQFNVYFATDNPIFIPQDKCDMHFLLPPDIAERKTAALKAQESQFDAMFAFLGDKGVEAAVGAEALVHSSHDRFWSK
jgi:LmbE family N-acetylglucosaminyl deacetylase